MNLDRRTAILALLEHRDDHLPSMRPGLRPPSGFAHGVIARESCPDCLANGRRMFGCETCRGRGYLERRRRKDPYDTGQSQGWFGSSAARHERARERDREIDRLAEQTAAPVAEAAIEVRPDAWEVARARHLARFDFPALDGALESLRLSDPDAHHALHAVYVYAYVTEISPRLTVRIEAALVFLDELLPDPLRVPN